jgi:carbon storage regulator
MLTLTRKEGESIVIGGSIRVTVKSIRGRNVRLMVAAPDGVAIYREELYLAIQEANRAAAQIQGDLPQEFGRAVVALDPGSAGREEKP